MSELPSVPPSISHKSLNAILLKAKKENPGLPKNHSNCCPSNNELDIKFKAWSQASKELLKELGNRNTVFYKDKKPKAIMALGAMEVYINLAIQALRASELEQK